LLPSQANSTPLLRGAVLSAVLDGDGFPDLAAANRVSGDFTYLQGGPGGFSEERKQTVKAGTRPVSLGAGDFDGDGFLDLAVGNEGSASVTCLRGGANGLSDDPDRRTDLAVGRSPIALAAGEFDGDGFPDVLVASNEADSVNFLRGGAGGLERGGELAAGTAPRALLCGSFGGLGLADALVVNSGSGTVTQLRPRYLVPHATLLDPAEGPAPPPLLDPRNPPRYRPELPASAFSDPTQVTVVPGPAELPQGLSLAGRPFRPLSDPVSILPEGAAPMGGAWLVLRLRDPGAGALSLRAFHRPSPTAAAVALEAPVEIIDFENGKGRAARFRISTFGWYLVAAERER